MADLSIYKDKKVLVTGGLGFIGSNLAIKLQSLGANITLSDSMIPGYGGNLFNIDSIKDLININFSDIRDEHATNYLVKEQDYIFHLAAQVSHIMSLSDPFPDIDINIKGTAILLEACKKQNPDVKIIRCGTRGQYGAATKLPVSEDAPTNPKGIYEISQLTAEKIMEVYHNVHGIKSVLLRLTNIFGPRAQMRHSHYGVANWFIRLALDDATIPIYGDGSIKRDFLYVDDCVSAMLEAGACESAYGEIFNVGVDKPSTFLELTKIIVNESNSGKWEFTPFSKERAAQEPGDFYTDISKIKSIVGWTPKESLQKGISNTVKYYKKYSKYYW